jgi:hypothetical protein
LTTGLRHRRRRKLRGANIVEAMILVGLSVLVLLVVLRATR